MESIWRSFIYAVFLVEYVSCGQMCYDCARIPFPRDCGHVAVCGDTEVCITREIINDSGVVWYNTRCEPKERCIQTRRDVTMDPSDETGDLTVCEDCCHGDFCNSNGCGTQPLPPLSSRGPVCFNCKQQRSHDSCDIVTVCGHEEICMLTSSILPSGDLVFQTGCKHKSLCDGVPTLVGRRDVPGSCSGCCSGDYCNRNCSSLHHHHMGQHTSPSTATSPTHPQTHRHTSTEGPRISTSVKMTMAATSTTHTTTVITTSSSTKATTTKAATTMTTTLSPAVEQETLCKQLGYSYTSTFNTCFKLYTNQLLPWQQSRGRCQQDGGDLLVVRSLQEEAFLQAIELQLRPNPLDIKFWVGATDYGREGQWVWLDGSAVAPGFWHPTEPNNAYLGEDCAAMTYYPDGTANYLDGTANLNDFSCAYPFNFICEVNLTGIAQVVRPSFSHADQCHQRGYTYSPQSGICYHVYKDRPLTFTEAKDKCHSEGAELLTLSNVGAEHAIQQDHFYDTDGNHRYWLGAHKLSNGSFYWLNGQPIRSDIEWTPDEPNNYGGNEWCITLMYNQKFALNDDDCSKRLYYICEAADLRSPSVHCLNAGYQYIPETGTCFHVYQHPVKDYAGARRKCQSERADLMMMKDVNLEHVLQHQAFYDSDNTHRYWVGANRATDGSFYWLNHQPMSSSLEWLPDEPNNYNHNETCVSLTYTYHLALNDDNCYKELYYICEEKCPDASYTYVAGLDFCFKIYYENATWAGAQARCHGDHAQLAEPDNLATFTYLQRVVDRMTGGGYDAQFWLGATDPNHDRHFEWVTSRAAILSRFWHTGEPSVLVANEHCASLWRFSLEPTLLLNDVGCDYQSYFICQNVW